MSDQGPQGQGLNLLPAPTAPHGAQELHFTNLRFAPPTCGRVRLAVHLAAGWPSLLVLLWLRESSGRHYLTCMRFWGSLPLFVGRKEVNGRVSAWQRGADSPGLFDTEAGKKNLRQAQPPLWQGCMVGAPESNKRIQEFGPTF